VSKSPFASHFSSIEVCAVPWLPAASLAPFRRSVGLFAYTSHGCLLANSALSGFVVVLGIFVKHFAVLELYAFAAFSFDFFGGVSFDFCGLVFFFFIFSFSSQVFSG
jgi:hypothetical protein